MNKDQIKKIAMKKWQKNQKAMLDPTFRRTIGKLVHKRILESNYIPPYPGKIGIEEALRAGEVEPRVFEVLPALILRKPKLFTNLTLLPADLKEVIMDIRKNRAKKDFRGVPPHKYLYWLDKFGHKNKGTNVLKTFRFSSADIELFKKASKKLSLKSEIEVLRAALRNVLI